MDTQPDSSSYLSPRPYTAHNWADPTDTTVQAMLTTPTHTEFCESIGMALLHALAQADDIRDVGLFTGAATVPVTVRVEPLEAANV